MGLTDLLTIAKDALKKRAGIRRAEKLIRQWETKSPQEKYIVPHEIVEAYSTRAFYYPI